VITSLTPDSKESYPFRGETAAAAATSRGLPQRHRPAARILALSCGAPVGKAN